LVLAEGVARTVLNPAMVLWQGESGRHQGAMESQALYLMGIEPEWNSRGVVDRLKLIPEEELGRPRVNVVFTASGLYRDGMADKIVMLDRAARMAAAARNIHIPVLIVSGSNSEVVNHEGVAQLRQLIPQAQSFQVPGATHMVAGDQNDAFNEAVSGFVRELSTKGTA